MRPHRASHWPRPLSWTPGAPRWRNLLPSFARGFSCFSGTLRLARHALSLGQRGSMICGAKRMDSRRYAVALTRPATEGRTPPRQSIAKMLVGHRSPLGPAPFDETMQARRCVISHHGCGAAPSTIMMLFARRRRSPRVLVGPREDRRYIHRRDGICQGNAGAGAS
jgi:hypothetical protein